MILSLKSESTQQYSILRKLDSSEMTSYGHTRVYKLSYLVNIRTGPGPVLSLFGLKDPTQRHSECWEGISRKELDQAEVHMLLMNIPLDFQKFYQGFKKNKHSLSDQSLSLPPPNHISVANEVLSERTSLLVFCKPLQTFL